jgi:hypothetical protein
MRGEFGCQRNFGNVLLAELLDEMEKCGSGWDNYSDFSGLSSLSAASGRTTDTFYQEINLLYGVPKSFCYRG